MYITVPDDRIIAVNRPHPGAENEEASIIYRDEQGELHKIDLAICVVNYCKERGIDPTGVTCAGERNIIEGYFEFWTSRLHTRIVFPKRHRREWKGYKRRRFHAFQRLLAETGYSTLDLT